MATKNSTDKTTDKKDDANVEIDPVTGQPTVSPEDAVATGLDPDETSVTPTVNEAGSGSKASRLMKSAKSRNQTAQEAAKAEAEPDAERARSQKQLDDNQRSNAEKMAAINVQGRDNSLEGELDLDAMGDLKGDGGDAKNYADNDPLKAQGVPTVRHGLSANANGPQQYFDGRQSARTQSEMEAGKKALESRRPSMRTEVTDAS